MLVSDAVAEEMLNTQIDADLIISLHTADPGSTGANEITGAHRVTLTTATDWAAFATVSGARVVTNANEEEFTATASADETVTHFTIWAADGTTFKLSNTVTTPQAITTGNPIKIPAGNLTFGMKTTI